MALSSPFFFLLPRMHPELETRGGGARPSRARKGGDGWGAGRVDEWTVDVIGATVPFSPLYPHTAPHPPSPGPGTPDSRRASTRPQQRRPLQPRRRNARSLGVAVFRLLPSTASRWRRHVEGKSWDRSTVPQRAPCGRRNWRINGDFDFLEYIVCTASTVRNIASLEVDIRVCCPPVLVHTLQRPEGLRRLSPCLESTLAALSRVSRRRPRIMRISKKLPPRPARRRIGLAHDQGPVMQRRGTLESACESDCRRESGSCPSGGQVSHCASAMATAARPRPSLGHDQRRRPGGQAHTCA